MHAFRDRVGTISEASNGGCVADGMSTVDRPTDAAGIGSGTAFEIAPAAFDNAAKSDPDLRLEF